MKKTYIYNKETRKMELKKKDELNFLIIDEWKVVPNDVYMACGKVMGVDFGIDPRLKEGDAILSYRPICISG
jgi:hypothetical protein